MIDGARLRSVQWIEKKNELVPERRHRSACGFRLQPRRRSLGRCALL